MAELVDAPASGAGACKGVEVRVLFWAPNVYSLPSVDDQKPAPVAGFLLFEGHISELAFC
jgi:hypothetical protein